MEDVVTVFANAMYMIDSLGKATVFKAAWILFHKLFETIFVKLLIFHMKILMFLHIGLIFESKLTSGPVAMEVCCLLTSEGAMRCAAVLAASISKKSFTLDSVILAMVIKVHLDI